AFIEPLGQRHGLLGREAQLARCLLLQLGGDEWRLGPTPSLLALDLRDLGDARAQLACNLLGGRLGLGLGLLALPAPDARDKRRWLRRRALAVDGPILLGHEPGDLDLAVADDAHRHRLHAASRKPAPNLLPQKRADLVADQAIEDPPRLLSVGLVGV